MALSGDAQNGAGPAPAAKPDRTMLVLYGSETGNSQEIAEDIDRIAQKLRFKSTLAEMNSIQPSALLRHSLVVFVIPTTGQGDFPRNAAALWKKLLRKKLLPGCLSSVKFTSFGLGDTSYPRFNWAARKLVRRMEQLGASQFFPIGEADERHPDGLDELYLRWATKFEAHLLATYPIPGGLEPLPDDVPLPPRYLLRWNSEEVPAPAPTPVVNAERGPPVPGARTATLVSNERITAPDHFQDVRLLKLDLPDSDNGTRLDLAPGDTITMYPKNDPGDAQKLIEWMSWESVADTPIFWPESRAPASLYREDGSPPPTLRSVVLESLDITAVPRRSFLRSISHFSSDPAHKERLLEFTAPEFLDEYYDYATRPRRTILEILHEFSSVKVPPERALDTFPLIRGREFSIANGGDYLRHPTDGSLRRVEIVAALVRYKTILRKERVGLCSRFIDTLEPGTLVPVLHKKALTPLIGPERDSRPLVGVATGTGVAPIRSLLQHRATTSGPRADGNDGTTHDAPSTATVNPPSHLFFGFRSAETDFHFSDEWSSLYPGLTLHPAESRPAPSPSIARIYVQDVMSREAAVLADMVRRRAVFWICGGSHRMAQAVREAVISAIGGEGEAEREKAFEGVDWIQEIW